MAVAVSDREMAVRSRGKAPAEAVRRSHSTTAPLRNMAIAHKNETRTKKRWTVGLASNFRGERAEVVCKALGEGSTQERGTHEHEGSEEGTRSRLYEVQKDASGQERDDGSHRQEDGAEQEEGRHTLTSHQPPCDDQIRPGERADQGATEPRDQEHAVVCCHGRHDALEHDGCGVPQHDARRGHVQQGAGASFGIVLEVERPQCRAATVGSVDDPPYRVHSTYVRQTRLHRVHCRTRTARSHASCTSLPVATWSPASVPSVEK